MTAAKNGVAVVTGATGGMGRVLALALARRGMHVVTVARAPQRARELRDEIARDGAGSLEVIPGDLSHRAGIHAATAAIRERHDVIELLINNAGAHYGEHRLSADGIEMHVAVDYLAAYGMTVLLASQLRSGRARVVNVASDTLRDTRRLKGGGQPRPATLDIEALGDLALLNPTAGFVPFEAYARAKLLTVIAGYALARTLAGEVTVNAVHPGIVATDIIRDVMPAALRPFGGLLRRAMLTPEQGAAAALRLATDPDLDGVTGRYFVRDTDTPTPPVSYSVDVQTRLLATTDRFLESGTQSFRNG
ncbi:SDR family NAD(P)-dependent oxidoreductase [Microbacterium mcarthurae (nom. nud.)]|uniref:SDR family NAD(P)-dependent oxidoreductase n=1 Tax=Microbacterium mcarthurae TaxID=3035918 RepID=A0ABW9GGK4_9MICO